MKKLEAITDILRLYTDETDDKDWVVAWSGGKDSTAVLGLITSAIKALPQKNRKRRVHVIMSNTKIENPVLDVYMHEQVTKFNDYVRKHCLPMDARIVARPVEKSYFVLTIGRGYFLPLRNGKGRWCTERLKIEPSNNSIKGLKPSFKVVGTRSLESMSRAESINKHRISYKITEDTASKESKLFMPIVDWSVNDVWAYLSEDKLGWASTIDVRTLYKEATGECGVNNPIGVEEKAKQFETCGARFGCWLCPVVTNDRSTEVMSQTHKWLEPLSDWRNLQLKVYGQYKPQRPDGQKRKDRSADLRKWEAINEKVKLITKAGYNRAGKRMKDGQGTLTVEARRFLLDKLIETQTAVNILRAEECLSAITLITEDEIVEIEKNWAEDERNFTHLLSNKVGLSIYELDDILN